MIKMLAFNLGKRLGFISEEVEYEQSVLIGLNVENHSSKTIADDFSIFG